MENSGGGGARADNLGAALETARLEQHEEALAKEGYVLVADLAQAKRRDLAALIKVLVRGHIIGGARNNM